MILAMPSTTPRAACWRVLALAAGLALLPQLPATAQTNAPSKPGAPIGSTLNLKDADISTLISTVGDITGRNFIVDPRVKGKVTVLSSTPMSPDELYGVFLAVLQVHGFAAVPAGPVIKIVPEVGAKQDGGSYFDFEGLADDEIVTRVIEIQNVPAAQLVPILRPLVPQYGHLAAYSPSNMLIISDRKANAERLTQIIQRIDQGGDREVEFIRLSHAAAADVQRTLSELLNAEQKNKDPSEQPVTLLADERTNSMLLAGDKDRRLQLRALIAHLDIPLEEDGDTQVIYLSYADAEKLAPILEGYVESSSAAKDAKAAGAAPAGAGAVAGIRIVADPDTNALVITAPPKVMRGLRGVIAQLDIRRAQVLVEAILAEVSLTTSRSLGIDAAVLNDERIAAASIFDTSVLTGALAAATGNFTQASGLLRQGLNVAGGRIQDEGASFALLLNALAGDGETNVLSTPSLVTMDNEEAEISVGQEVPFVTGSFTSTGGTSNVANPFQTIQRKDVGLTLGITPQITEGNTIKLTINQESSSIAGSSAGAADLITNKRTLSTTVMVGDGDILVLGGLMDDNVRRSEQKVPILGDIPLLGALFRSSTQSKSKQNLMIFIRTKILRDRATSDYYTHKKYNRMRHLQGEALGSRWSLISRPQGPQLEELPAPHTNPPGNSAAPAAQAEPAQPASAEPVAATEARATAAEHSQDNGAQAAQQPATKPLISTEPVISEEAEARRMRVRGHLR